MAHRLFARGLLLIALTVASFAAPRAAPPSAAGANLPAEAEIFSALPEPVLRKLLEDGLRQLRRNKSPRANGDVDDGSDNLLPTDDAPQDIRLKAGDTVLLRFDTQPPMEKRRDPEAIRGLATPPPPLPPPAEKEPSLTPEERQEFDKRQRLRKATLPNEQVFVLDHTGAIVLTNIGRLALAGLNEEEAAERIAAEPALRGLYVTLRRLPVEAELKPFGHDLFVKNGRRFTPATDIPVPADYVVGPGDTLLVQVFGKESGEHELVVTRDGLVHFPGLGPIPIVGKKFSQVQKELHERVRRQLIGARASIGLGRLRTMRVFVLGEVEQPGSYVVSGLATLTNALLASGGIRPYGSLRDVQLKRDGQVVARLDVYRLLLHGDSQGDARVLPGDIIFVPPARLSVGIAGRVRRPAIYELKDEKTLAELIDLAGGLLPDADTRSVQIERVTEALAREVTGGDVRQTAMQNLALRDGDTVRVFPIAERYAQAVQVEGHVERPGRRPWRDGMRLTDLLPALSALKPEADTRYVLIKRLNRTEGTTELFGADLLAALEQPDGPANARLAAEDTVHVFDRREDRVTLLEPLLTQARASTGPARPLREVSVQGAVHHPGRYPWSPDMRVVDLLHAAGGLTDQAYILEAELTRFASDGRTREQARQVIDLAAALKGKEKNVALAPYDQLVVRRVPKWSEEGTVEITGEVKFPGVYPIVRGERLSRLLQRAGGLSEYAYPKGAVFLRQSVRAREQEYLERLTAQLERDLAVFATAGPEIGVKKEAALAEGQALLRQMRAAQATGRMVINLAAVVDDREGYDIVVQPGDKLHVPQRSDEVTVLGEVYYPTSHLHVADYGRDDYIRLSGGVTERGNKRAVYVVHADGSVSPPRGWFGGHVAVGPGDTVIVPLKVDRVSSLKLFTDISTILFQLAVTAAALDAIGVL